MFEQHATHDLAAHASATTPALRVTPYAYQSGAVAEIAAHVAAGKRRVLLYAPTGAGKTVMLAMRARQAADEGKRVLLFAHTREIIRQTARKLRDAGVASVGICLGGASKEAWSRDFGGLDAQVVVGSIQSLRGVAHERLGHFDVVMVDEAHHTPAKSYRELVARYPGAEVIGASATPWRGAGKGLASDFDVMVVAATVRGLVADGRLAPAVVYTWAEILDLDLDDVKVTKGADGERDYDRAEVAKKVNTAKLRGDIVKHWHWHAKGRRTVVFAASLEHAQDITRQFNADAAFKAAGWAAEYLDGTTALEDREAMLDRLATSPRTRVVVNYGVLTEGFDAPMIECVVLARPTLRPGIYVQAIGRGRRVVDGKHDVVVLDHAGLCLRFGMPDADRECDLGGLAQSAETGCRGGVLPVVRCPVCGRTTARGVETCPNPRCGPVGDGGAGGAEHAEGDRAGREPVVMCDPEGVLVEAVRGEGNGEWVRVEFRGQMRTITEIAMMLRVPRQRVRRWLDNGRDPEKMAAGYKPAKAVLIEFRGGVMAPAKIAKILGVPLYAVRAWGRSRLDIEKMAAGYKPAKAARIEFRGESKTFAEIATTLGLPQYLIYRWHLSGKDIDVMAADPTRKGARVEFRGRMRTTKEIAEMAGVAKSLVSSWRRLGKNLEEMASVHKPRCLRIKFRGEARTPKEIAGMLGVPAMSVRGWHARGRDIEAMGASYRPYAPKMMFRGALTAVGDVAKTLGVDKQSLMVWRRKGLDIEAMAAKYKPRKRTN